MKSLNNYISQNNNEYLQFVQESLDNNTRIINESKLITEHGKDIDNLLYRFKNYTYDNLYKANQFNENSKQYELTLNESQTFRDLMIYICEDYRDKLLEELNIYESLIVDGQLITEGKFTDKVKNASKNLVDNIKQTWELGKDKVNQAIETLKTKIKEVNELIKEYATKAVKTVKEMAIKLVSLLSKFDCTLEGLFKKMGFDTDKESQDVEAIGASLADNPDYLKKNDVYESFANSIKNQINEEEDQEDKTNDKGEVVKQADKKSTKQMLWEGFKQLMVWAGVCVVIPGFVCGLFPGTFLALIVPIVCKLLWNGYKIYKMVKQWKKVKQEWGTYTKRQKWITAIGMIASIIALAFNFGSIANSFGKIWDAFVKSGGDLMANANLGIQPDILTRAFGSLVKMIKEGKFSWEDFQASFKSITDSFAEHIPQADKVVKYTGHVGQKAEDVMKKFIDNDKTSSVAALKDIGKESINPDDIAKMPSDSMIDLCVNGTPDSVYGKALTKAVKAAGSTVDPNNAVNQVLKGIKALAGSVYSIKVPKDVAMELLKNAGKYAKDGFIYAIGATAEATQNIPVEDIVNAATSMLVTIPSVEVEPQNNGGFRVRLGGEKDKNNYIYKVGENGVRKDKVTNFKEQYDKIKEYVKDVNIKFLEELKNNEDLDDDKKKEIEDKLKEFNDKYKENIDKQDAIIFYGKRVKEESQNESSIKSLYDYIINEAEENKKSKYSIDDIKANFIDLRKYLDQIGKDNNTETKGKNTYLGNTRMLLQSIFSTKDTGKASHFVYDKDYKPTPYEIVKKRTDDDDKSNDKFGPTDIEELAVCYTIWKGPDNDKTYEAYVYAFIDVIALRNQFMNKENEDIIIAAYTKMIENLLKVESIAKEVKDREWKRGEEWAPLKFDESKVDDNSLEKVEDAEKSAGVETSKKDAKDELEKSDAPIPDESEEKKDKKEDESDDKDSDKEIPILMFANVYGMDIADANKQGPRKDPYSLKGAFHSLTFYEIEGGTSKTNIQKMLGEILAGQTQNLYNIVANKPCDDKKYELNKWNKGDEERADFGNLTNDDIAKILNDKEYAVKCITEKTNNIKIAETEEDKEYLAKKEEEYTKKLENPDEETIKLVKNAYPDAIDKDGKIKKDYKDENGKTLPQIFSDYSLAQHKSENTKKSGGLFTKLKNFVKGLFGGNKERGKKVNSVLKHLDESLNESLQNPNKYDEFLDECFDRISLKDYIKYNK